MAKAIKIGKTVDTVETENVTFSNFIENNKIKISGLEKMPEIGITRILYENPWNEDDECLNQASKMKLTVSLDKDGKIHSLNKVSDDYKLVQHEEAIWKSLDQIITRFPEFGTPDVDLNFRKHGGIMHAKYTFPKAVEIQEGDPIKPVVVLTNSVDLSKRFSLTFGAFRMICTNGMVIPDRRFPNATLINKLHKVGTLDLDDAIHLMMEGFHTFSSTIELFQRYTTIQMGRSQFEEIMDASPLSVAQAKEILTIPLRGFNNVPLETDFLNGTTSVWKAYNAATQFITDHNRNESTTLERGRAIAELFDNMTGINA